MSTGFMEILLIGRKFSLDKKPTGDHAKAYRDFRGVFCEEPIDPRAIWREPIGLLIDPPPADRTGVRRTDVRFSGLVENSCFSLSFPLTYLLYHVSGCGGNAQTGGYVNKCGDIFTTSTYADMLI